MRRPSAVLVVLALLVAACSGGGGGGDGEPTAGPLPEVEVVAPEVVVDAVRAAQAEGTASFEFAYLDENQVGRTSITGDGVTTLDGQQAEAEFTLTILGQENVGVTRTVDGVRYIMSGGTGQWQRSVDREDPGTADVAGRVEELLALDVELTKAGQEEVAGVPTTKYAYTLPDSTDDESGATTSQSGGSFWVDEDGRLRQFDARRVVEQGGVTRIVADLVTLLEFNVDVDVEAPPEDLVETPTESDPEAPAV